MATIELNGQTIDVDAIDIINDPYKWAFCELYSHITQNAEDLQAKADMQWETWFEDKTTANMSKFLQIDSNAAEMFHLISYMQSLISGLVDPNK